MKKVPKFSYLSAHLQVAKHKATAIGFAIIFTITAMNTTFAQSKRHQSIGNLTTFKQTETGLLVETAQGQMQITVYATDIIRIRVVQAKFDTDFSYAVSNPPQKTKFEVTDETEKLTLRTELIRLEVSKNPVRLKFMDKDGEVLNEDESYGTGWIGEQVTTYKKLQRYERFIGLGAKIGNLDKRGESYVNWNTDAFMYNSQTDPLYSSFPFFIGILQKTEYGIFFDNTHKTTFNFGASNNSFASFSADSGEMNYYFIHNQSVRKIIESYTNLTGRMTLPPLWSLGFQQCRYSYFPDKEVLSIAKNFRERKIPIDVLYLDIHYMDNYKVFTWHPTGFAKPQEMLAELKNMGINVVVIIDPGIKEEKGYKAYEDGLQEDVFLKYPDGKPYTGAVWAGWSHFPDFTKPKTRTWWGKQFSGYVNDGITGFWNDMNEPSTWGQRMPDLVEFDYEGQPTSHRQGRNVFGMQMARSTYEGTRKLMNGKRPFILTRAGYSGVQRYSAMWTGDDTATDENMLLNVRMVNGLGLSGMQFVSYDIGGFINEPTKALFARWLTVGTFSPFMRVHTMYDNKSQEPWSFGESITNISKKFIQLRYNLLPYIYSNFYAATQTGLPIQRSMAVDYAHDITIYDTRFQNQYLFGDHLLIAPCESTQKFAKVYLPETKDGWYHFYNDKKYKKGEVIVDADLAQLPIFVKAGAVLPTQSDIQSTKEVGDKTLYLHVYAAENSYESTEFVYYEDDGNTYGHEKGEFYKRKITYKHKEKEIVFGEVEGTFVSKFDKVEVVFHGFYNLNSAFCIQNGKDFDANLRKFNKTTLQMVDSYVQTVNFDITNTPIVLYVRER